MYHVSSCAARMLYPVPQRLEATPVQCNKIMFSPFRVTRGAPRQMHYAGAVETSGCRANSRASQSMNTRTRSESYRRCG
jgi:hypothetical protein